MEVSTLTPVSASFRPRGPMRASELRAEIAEAVGVPPSLTLYRLVEVAADEEEVDGALAFALPDSSRLSLEAIEHLLAEKRTLEESLRRTSQSLVALTERLEELEDEDGGGGGGAERERERAFAADEELQRLRRELEHSNSVRRESQQLVSALKREFHAMVRERALGVAEEPPASGVPPPNPPPRGAPAAEYRLVADVEAGGGGAAAAAVGGGLFVRMVGRGGASDTYRLPDKPGGGVAELKVSAARLRPVQLWLWRGADGPFDQAGAPVVRSVTVHRGKAAYSFSTQRPLPCANSRILRLARD